METIEELLLNDPKALRIYLKSLSSEEVALAVAHLNTDEQRGMIAILEPQEAAEVIDDLPAVMRNQIIEEIPIENAAAILNEFDSDDQADVISEMKEADDAEIMDQMRPEDVDNIKWLIQYEPDTAGGLMITEFLSYDENMTVRQVSDHLRFNAEKIENYHVQYIYVTSENKFIGVLGTRDLLLSQSNKLLSEIVIRESLTVNDLAPFQDLIHFFDASDTSGPLPRSV